MKITIRPDPDCIELIRSEFKDMVVGFLKSVGIPSKDAKNWKAPHTTEINENAPQWIDVLYMECFLPDELLTKPEWVFKFAKEELFTSFIISGIAVCSELSHTDGLKDLPKNLFNLYCYGNKSENLNEHFQELKSFPSIKCISFKHFTKIKDISLLESLVNLQWLELRECYSLTDISSLASLFNLQVLNLRFCESLTDISSLAGLLNLKWLNLGGSELLKDISSLSGLANLQVLELGVCAELTDISSLSGLANLQVLELGVCAALTDISSLSGLANLQALDLEGCAALTDISSLSKLVNLQTLNLNSCKSLTDISSLAGLFNLQTLDLNSCELLMDISSLAGLFNLQTLDFKSCESLMDISSLAGLANLQALDLEGCAALTDISSLSKLVNLQTLNLNSCKSLTDISSLSGLLNLQSLHLEDCNRIQNYLPLRNCLALNELYESNMHPAESAELLCFLAVQRKDIPLISVKTNSWLKELELGLGQKHSSTNDLACSLAKGIVLAKLKEVGSSFHQTLLNHPNIGLAPWKIWFTENLKTFGWNVIINMVKLKQPSDLPFGAIGGISACLPLIEGGPALIAWARKWISEIHSLHNNNSLFLKPAAAEWCLALKRLGEDNLLRAWIEKFTDPSDPSDPSALDPINKVFSAYALDLNDSEFALEYAFKINDPKLRDESILNLAQQFIKEGETTKAGEFLFLLTQIESRTQLAYSLAEDAVYLKSDENVHRLLAACGDSPQSLASILDKLRLANPDSEILKIMHEKLGDKSKSQIPFATVIKECNSLAEFLIHSKDPSQLVRIQQAIKSVMKSS